MATPTLKARRKFKQRLFFGLAVKPLRLFCNHCGKYIPSDSEWRCGYCDTENLRTKLYSFLRKCQQCKRPPKAFICPHCKEPNFLDKKRDATHAAWNIRTVVPAVVANAEELRSWRKQGREDEKSGLQHEIEIAKLNAELIMVKKSVEFKEKKSIKESLEESLTEFEANTMGARMAAKNRRELYAKEVNNDPDLLRDYDEMLQAWLDNYL
jgi:hypothetical protein